MAGKHDEMLIYILHSTVLAATAGTNLLLSVEKSKCWRQTAPGATSVMKIPPLGVVWSAQRLSLRNSLAALSHRTYPDVVQRSPQRWHFFLVPCKIRPAVREKVRKHRAAESCFEAVGKWAQGALRSPRTPWGRAGKLGRTGTGSLQGEGDCGVPSSSSPSSASWLHLDLLELGDGFIFNFRQLVDSLTLLWFCVEDQPVYFVYLHTQTFRFGKARPSRTTAF